MCPYDPDKHHRRSIRLPDYDYSTPGAYFITLCVHNHASLFGVVEGCDVRLSPLGEIVRDEWLRTPAVRPRVVLDIFIVMPNHFHAVFFLASGAEGDAVGKQPHSLVGTRTCKHPRGPERGSVGALVGQFKGAVSRAAKAAAVARVGPIWQRDFHEHVIRDDKDLDARREYIQGNPARWTEDEYYHKGMEEA